MANPNAVSPYVALRQRFQNFVTKFNNRRSVTGFWLEKNAIYGGVVARVATAKQLGFETVASVRDDGSLQFTFREVITAPTVY